MSERDSLPLGPELKRALFPSAGPGPARIRVGVQDMTAALEEAAQLSSGSTLGRYRIEEELGRGGAGVVYRAWDTTLERPVALKLLTATWNEPHLRRFAREASALAALHHEHIVRLHQVEEERGVHYLVLDLIAGESLQARLDREGPLSPFTAAALLRDVADAVACAHETGVLHRDIKPGNVLVEPDGRALLTDFGLTRSVDGQQSGTQLSQSGVLLGTPGFMSPEQVKGQLRVLGPATDVFGLGATLYAALTGRAPFAGDSLFEVLTQMDSPVAPASSVRGDVPRQLDRLCEKCLAERPEDRFPTARAVVAALDAFLAGEGETKVRASRRRTVPALLAGIAAAGLLAVLAWPAERVRFASESAGSDLESGPDAGVASARPGPEVETEPDAGAGAELLQAGAALLAAGDAVGAAASYTEYLRQTPRSEQDPRAWEGRGRARLQLGENEAALEDVTVAVELDPSLATAWALAAGARNAMGDPRGARDDLDRALALHPEEAWPWHNRANLSRALGENELALEEYGRALSLDPDLYLARYNRAMLRRDVGDLKGASEDIAFYVAANPNEGPARSALGWILLRLGEREAGRAQIFKATEVSPDFAPAWFAKGVLLKEEGDRAGAFRAFERSLGEDPTYPPPYAERGILWAEAGGREEARADWRRFLELEPEGPRADEIRQLLNE